MASVLRVDQLQTQNGTNVMSFDSAGNAVLSSGLKLPSFTNSTRPTGQIGLIIYNTEEEQAQIFDGTEWTGLGGGGKIQASGGDKYNSGVYTIHKFAASGTFTVTSAPSSATMDVLLVGGGGGGGAASQNCSNGGGGAGGLVYKQAESISTGGFPVVVGSGGNGRVAGNAGPGDNGGDSTFNGWVALGGGGGGGGSGVNGGRGNNGGSGGGGAHQFSGPISTGLQPTSATGGFGNAGGAANNSGPEWGGGGGGGAGGTAGASSANSGAVGGVGSEYDIDGTSKFYAGGGAGSNCGNPSCAVVSGGNGGGGPASCNVGTDGTNGLGGGGGGGGYSGGVRSGGRGGNGVVIIRYLT